MCPKLLEVNNIQLFRVIHQLIPTKFITFKISLNCVTILLLEFTQKQPIL